MGEQKHTPGPWRAIKPAFGDKNQEEDRLIMSKEDHHVAEVFQYRQEKHHAADGTALANAHLIAKAPLIPELVEVLRELADLQNGPPLVKYEAAWNEAMKKTYALLTKTEKP